MSILESLFVILTLFWVGGIFIIIFPMLFLLKGKRISEVEAILEDGVRFYSLNIFMTGWGALHYATIFFSDWHAKRYKMLDKRNLVPKHLKVWFIVYYVIFMALFAAFMSSAFIFYFYLEKD